MTDIEKKKIEIRKNFKAFQKQLPSIEPMQAGKFAVLRHEKIIDYFDSMGDAAKYADAQYKEGVYSIQEVSSSIVDLGYFSHAGSSKNI